MSQSHRHSLYESAADTAIGLAISVGAIVYVFPLFGVVMSLTQNLWATGVMTALSFARRYALRRLFNRWHR